MMLFRRPVPWFMAIAALLAAAGCASTHGKPPPTISLNEQPALATPTIDDPGPPALHVADPPTRIVEIPKPLPLPGQLMLKDPPTQLDATAESPQQQVTQANREALVVPRGDRYINAIQVWPFTEGALYQIYTSPDRVTAIALQPSETLITVSAGDTARWIVGDTSSGSGHSKRAQILVKPTRSGLHTDMIVTTDRRTYLLDLMATESTWMASVSWSYPLDELAALKSAATKAVADTPVAAGLSLERLRFRYAVTGDEPPWRPLRAFDDGAHVYIQFPSGIAQGELPPLFIVGPQGDAQLVNYRYRAPYYIVDRLFGAAELRLGGDGAQVVRITRTDGSRSARR